MNPIALFRPSTPSRRRRSRGLAARAALLAALLISPAAPSRASEAPSPALRRLALAVGAHEGGAGRDRLLYASSDAQAFLRTLEELGGLAKTDATLLSRPDREAFRAALRTFAAEVGEARKANARVEAVVYYSGHADEKGLLFGDERLDYAEFRRAMDALPADVRLAVVDACASGALTRLKGGRKVSAFLVDQSVRSEGTAILTSSSENEAAQESDRVGGSYFTHALNTGLRGAADASGDGKVTLHEAYQFAYHETLARTEKTSGGPQHAGYDIRLNGSGDVVLTDLRSASATLELPKELRGRLFLRDSSDHLAAELLKPAGQPMIIGLPPGPYTLRLQRDGAWSGGAFRLEEGKATRVDPAALAGLGIEKTALRGGPPEAGDKAQVPQDTSHGWDPGRLLYDGRETPHRGIQFALAATRAERGLRGGQVSIVTNISDQRLEGFQASMFNVAGDAVEGAQIGEFLNFSDGPYEGFQGAGFLNVNAKDFKGAQITGITGINGGSFQGFQGAGIFAVAGKHFQGFQAAGIFTVAAKGSRSGAGMAQGAGIFNVSGGAVKGGQGAGIFNVTGGALKGGQGAGIFNAAGDSVLGGQGAGIFNAAWGGVQGGQGAGILNFSGGDVKGGQGAGILNFTAGEVKGGQGAGILNVAWNGVQGGQGAGILNVSAGETRGVQIAGILNVAGRMDGYQFGLINIAGHYGKGFPLGLVNIAGNGRATLSGWTEGTDMQFAGFRTGVKGVYTQFAMGHRDAGPVQVWAPTLGFGGRWDFHPLFHFQTDLLSSSLWDGSHWGREPQGWHRLRSGFGFSPMPWLSFEGGVTYNLLIHDSDRSPFLGRRDHGFDGSAVSGRFWPGIWAGIEIGKVR